MVLGDTGYILLGDALETTNIAIVTKITHLDSHCVLICKYLFFVLIVGLSTLLCKSTNTFDYSRTKALRPKLDISDLSVLNNIMT
jgi:hypothetical protein